MKRKKLDPKLQLNHHLIAISFIASTCCVTCQFTEGACRDFCNGNWDDCFKRCYWFNQAVHKAEKILDKYDK